MTKDVINNDLSRYVKDLEKRWRLSTQNSRFENVSVKDIPCLIDVLKVIDEHLSDLIESSNERQVPLFIRLNGLDLYKKIADIVKEAL